MRLRVVFEAPGPVWLPWRYPEYLRGMVYGCLRRWDSKLGQKLHEGGLESEGHLYKPFTYSWLFPRRARKAGQGLLMEGPIRWWVSSPWASVLEAVVGPLVTAGQAQLGEVSLTVALVVVEEEPPLEPPLEVVALSPIVASTLREEGGKLRRPFLSPWEDEFQRVISQNLRRKARALGREVSEAAQVRLEPLGGVKSRLVEVNGVRVRGFEGRFRAMGDLGLLRVGYEMGFGERNAQGFGMVAVRR